MCQRRILFWWFEISYDIGQDSGLDNGLHIAVRLHALLGVCLYVTSESSSLEMLRECYFFFRVLVFWPIMLWQWSASWSLRASRFQLQVVILFRTSFEICFDFSSPTRILFGFFLELFGDLLRVRSNRVAPPPWQWDGLSTPSAWPSKKRTLVLTSRRSMIDS